MADINRSINASVDGSTAMVAPQISGLLAGEDLSAGAPCYIASDGSIKLCNATAADEKAVLAGFATRTAKAGQAVTLVGAGARFRYVEVGDALTPGQILYLSGTPGELSDDATTGDMLGVAQAITPTDIRVTRNITGAPHATS